MSYYSKNERHFHEWLHCWFCSSCYPALTAINRQLLNLLNEMERCWQLRLISWKIWFHQCRWINRLFRNYKRCWVKILDIVQWSKWTMYCTEMAWNVSWFVIEWFDELEICSSEFFKCRKKLFGLSRPF